MARHQRRARRGGAPHQVARVVRRDGSEARAGVGRSAPNHQRDELVRGAARAFAVRDVNGAGRTHGRFPRYFGGSLTMFFSAYVGPASGARAWEAAVTAHGRWLGW